jgi:TonB family protein
MTELNDDIARYLSGRMSAAEMHALEKKALDDPFLADALSGGESMLPDEFIADVDALQAQIDQRATRQTMVAPPDADSKPAGRQVTLWSWPMRIAAGLLLLASASAIFYFLRDDQRKDNLALNEEVHDSQLQKQSEDDSFSQSAPAADSIEASTEINSIIEKPETATADTRADVDKEKPASNADLARQAISAPPAAAQSKDIQSATEVTADEIADTEAPPAERAERRELAFAETEKAAGQSKEEEPNADAARKSFSPAVAAESKVSTDKKKTADDLKNVFTGKVVDTDGNGIPGVNVIVKGTNTGTVTDIQGNYQLALDELKPTLVYTFIGYTNTEEVADVAKPTTINLEEDVTQLSEVVVAGYGAQRDMDPIESTYDFAYPVGGRRQYKQYLEKNLQYPQTALLNNVEGRVTVQFSVETTGSLADFKVLKGLGSGCDEEVIRLIKSGPKWTPTKRDEVAEKSVIKVRMRFQLPKEKKKK